MSDFELGEFLRELRGKKSLRDVSKITGLSHTYIRDVENGKSRQNIAFKPKAETLYKLAKAYNYNFIDLMKISGTLPDQTDEVIRLLDDDTPMMLDDYILTPQQKKKALEMLRLMFRGVDKIE
jgi:transcriptional regulator with XRE-family HTH domain